MSTQIQRYSYEAILLRRLHYLPIVIVLLPFQSRIERMLIELLMYKSGSSASASSPTMSSCNHIAVSTTAAYYSVQDGQKIQPRPNY